MIEKYSIHIIIIALIAGSYLVINYIYGLYKDKKNPINFILNEEDKVENHINQYEKDHKYDVILKIKRKWNKFTSWWYCGRIINKCKKFHGAEIWSFYYTIAVWMLPRLKKLREIQKQHFDMEWNVLNYYDYYDDVIKMFEIYANEDIIIYTKQQEDIIKKGWQSFPIIYDHLWW